MSLYNTCNDLQREQFLARAQVLAKKGAIVELSEKKPKRSLQSNKYLHVILSYFASQYGETMEYVKRNYYKFLCNRDMFVRERTDEFLGHLSFLRSSADLSQEEMNTSIERFRNWSAMEAGIYLPAPDEKDMLVECEVEIEKNKNFI